MKTLDESVANSVRSTLRYAEIFSASLTLNQLQDRLQGKVKLSVKELKKLIRSFDDVILRGEKVCLKHSKTEVFHPDPAVWQAKMREARRAATVIGKIPWVLAVIVTGSVAAENAHKDDDVDLLVVTKRNRLWLSRLILVPMIILMGKYQDKRQMQTVFPHRSVTTSDRWCLNLWLDEDSLAVPQQQRSLYTAHEVLLSKCVFQRGQTGKRFLEANTWIASFFANFTPPKATYRKKSDSRTSRNLFVNGLERFAYLLQRVYMKKSHTSEKISQSFAYFHPRDTASIVMKKFESKNQRA